MALNEEPYVSKTGWKCVKSQLAKTEGRDPSEYAKIQQFHKDNPVAMKNEIAKLKIHAPEYAED